MLIRSVIFVCLFNVLTVIQLLFWTPVFFFMSRENCWKVVRCWAWLSLHVHHWLIGTRFEFRGTENIPDGGYIMAAKHQSTWETYTMVLFLRDPSYILKRELMFLPFFGWFAMKADVISVNRGKKSEALKAMTRKAREHCESGRQIVIYPEGTRTHAYAPPSYKYGITHMYSSINVRVLPIALNSGLFWPRKGWRLYKGTIIVEFLPVIEPGLSGDQFSKHMQDMIEDTSNALMAEAQADPEFDGPAPPPVTDYL
ncbi:MAG: 1-acyl-sn-glycerol-3-phosphate acyltransferase [Pseudomonadota bacterium]